LIVSQYYPPDITAAAFRVRDMVEALNECGHKVTVLTTVPHRVVISGGGGEENSNNVNVHRFKVPKVTTSFLSRIINYLGFATLAVFFTLFKLRGKFDIIIISSPPLFLAITGYILAKLKRAKCIADIRDIWPDSAVAVNVVRQRSAAYRILKAVEMLLYKSSNYIICVSKPMKDYISSHVDSRKISVIYNGISKDITSNPLPEIKNKGGIKLVYVGNIGKFQGLDILIDAFARLDNEGYTDICLDIIGDGVEYERLLARAEIQGLNSIKFWGPVAREKLNGQLADADVFFLQLIDEPILEKTIPSKLFDYLYYNKPIIAGIKGEGSDIIRHLNCGIVYKPNDLEELLLALKIIKNNYNHYERASSTNREYLLQHFNRKRNFKEYFMKIL